MDGLLMLYPLAYWRSLRFGCRTLYFYINSREQYDKSNARMSARLMISRWLCFRNVVFRHWRTGHRLCAIFG
jgi:hypothetical protein